MQSRPTTQRFRASSDGLGNEISLWFREVLYLLQPGAGNIWEQPSALAGGHMPLSDEESLLCEESEEDEFDLTEVVIHQVGEMWLCWCDVIFAMTVLRAQPPCQTLARLQIRLRIRSGY